MNDARAHPARSAAAGAAGGFTLIEMVLAAAIMAIILLGLQSAMLLASRAAPDRASATTAAIKAGRALDQFSSDLTYATSITASSATSITFSVPDRNNDNSPETIRYSWSGVSGDPLLRSINGGADAPVAASVTAFQLTMNKRSRTRTTTYTESGEVLLSSNDGINPFYLGDADVDATDWWAQYFRPTLPGSASQWRVTRVKIRARAHGMALGETRVQLRTVLNGVPATVLEETSMFERNLTSWYAWQEFAFTGVSGRQPGTGLYLTIQWSSDTDSADVLYQWGFANAPNALLAKSTDGGNSWFTPYGQDLIYYVYGTYSTTDPAATDYWLTSVGCTLQCGSDQAGQVRTTIRTPDEPQVSGP